MFFFFRFCKVLGCEVIAPGSHACIVFIYIDHYFGQKPSNITKSYYVCENRNTQIRCACKLLKLAWNSIHKTLLKLELQDDLNDMMLPHNHLFTVFSIINLIQMFCCFCLMLFCIVQWIISFMIYLKAHLHTRFLLRSFSFWCMQLNGLTYECIRPSVQSYINQYFCDSTTQSHASEWETSLRKSAV